MQSSTEVGPKRQDEKTLCFEVERTVVCHKCRKASWALTHVGLNC